MTNDALAGSEAFFSVTYVIMIGKKVSAMQQRPYKG